MKRFSTLGAIVLLLLAGLGMGSLINSQAPIRHLSEAQRRQLFERTMANIRQICVPDVHDSLLDFCRQQATLLMALPECDAACRQLGSPHLSHPTR